MPRSFVVLNGRIPREGLVFIETDKERTQLSGEGGSEKQATKSLDSSGGTKGEMK